MSIVNELLAIRFLFIYLKKPIYDNGIIIVENRNPKLHTLMFLERFKSCLHFTI